MPLSYIFNEDYLCKGNFGNIAGFQIAVSSKKSALGGARFVLGEVGIGDGAQELKGEVFEGCRLFIER